MDYKPLDSIPYYKDCSPLVSGLGYALVSLNVVPQNGSIKVTAVISRAVSGDDFSAIGIDDCAKVHRVLLPRLEAVLDSQDIYMEVTSPGMERNIKNAAEFALFEGRLARVWDQAVTEWVPGRIVTSDSQSVTLEVVHEDDSDSSASEKVNIPYVRISKAKLLQM